MYKYFLYVTILIMFAFVTLINAKNFPVPGNNGENMAGSLDADVHGGITQLFRGDPIDFHMHAMGYLHKQHKGNCILLYNVNLTESGENDWEGVQGETPEKTDQLTYSSDGGFYKELEVDYSVKSIHPNAPGGEKWNNSYVKWTVSATVNQTRIKVINKGTKKEKKITAIVATDTAYVEDGNYVATPEPLGCLPNDQDGDGMGLAPSTGIFLADSESTIEPGDSATLSLVTSESYYWVDWYVKAPWESGDRGTHQEGTHGDGTSTTTSLNYTFPSGIMHTGDFLITAVIYRYSDMSMYEETYTVPVDMTPNCDDCTDGNSNCPNASAH